MMLILRRLIAFSFAIVGTNREISDGLRKSGIPLGVAFVESTLKLTSIPFKHLAVFFHYILLSHPSQKKTVVNFNLLYCAV